MDKVIADRLVFDALNMQSDYQNIFEGGPVGENTVEYIKYITSRLKSGEKQIEIYQKILNQFDTNKYNKFLSEGQKATVKSCQECLNAWHAHEDPILPRITDVVKAVKYFKDAESTTDVKRRSNKKTNKVAAQLREEAFFENVCQSIKKYFVSSITKIFWPAQIEKRLDELENIIIMLDNRCQQNLIRFFPPKVVETGDSSEYKSLVSVALNENLTPHKVSLLKKNFNAEIKIQQKRNKKRKNKKFNTKETTSKTSATANVDYPVENTENSVGYFAVDSKSVKKSSEVIDKGVTCCKVSLSDLLKSHNEVEVVFHDYCCQTDYVDVDDPEEFGDVDPLYSLVDVSDYEC